MLLHLLHMRGLSSRLKLSNSAKLSISGSALSWLGRDKAAKGMWGHKTEESVLGLDRYVLPSTRLVMLGAATALLLSVRDIIGQQWER